MDQVVFSFLMVLSGNFVRDLVQAFKVKLVKLESTEPDRDLFIYLYLFFFLFSYVGGPIIYSKIPERRFQVFNDVWGLYFLYYEAIDTVIYFVIGLNA